MISIDRLNLNIGSKISIFTYITARSGGTMISIEGLNLNIGSSISIYLDNIPCEVNQSQVKKNIYLSLFNFYFFLLID